MNTRAVATALAFVSLAASSAALGQSRSTLPSLQTQSAIESLPIARKDTGSRPDFREYRVDPAALPPSARERLKVNNQGEATTPLVVPNTMVIQFQPDTSQEQIDNLLRSRNLTVVETFPKLGAVKVQGDLGKYFTPQLTDRNANDALLRGMSNAIQDFRTDPIVRSVTPDVVVRSQADEVANLLKASDVVALVSTAGQSDMIDWGTTNIEADKLWNLPGAQDGVLFGVMDVGFARHEDIIFLELPDQIEVDDHGNHVAAIGCGRHGNGRGVSGVLPNCFVRARTGDVFYTSTVGGEPLRFFGVFSQILATLERFLGQYDDIKVVNLSMGYNWRRNFGINPDLAESAQWRSLVEMQGLILVSALELADKSGKVIFSAAGNDSSGLATPISAKYASPFNWAAITAREMNIARNGVVVEAHDPSHKRAPFSNVGGHMSCPGVDVLSAVAHDAARERSRSSYGKMSGTSMASPYCAAAHVLFGLVRPGYSGSEITDCLLASTQKSDTGAPIPKLTQALAKCPAKS